MPQIEFNYLGRFARGSGDWEIAPEVDAVDVEQEPRFPRTTPVTLLASTVDRPDGPELVAEWAWADGLVEPDEITRIAATWVQTLTRLSASLASL